MKNLFRTVPFLMILGLCFSSAAFSDDHSNGGQSYGASIPSKNSYGGSSGDSWEKTAHTQKDVARLTSSGQIPSMPHTESFGKIPKNLTHSEVLPSEHSPNPLSRPVSDGMTAVRQAEKALNSAQLPAAPQELGSETPE